MDVEDEGFAEDFGGVFAAVELGVETVEAAEGGELGAAVGFEAGVGELGFEIVDGVVDRRA